MRLLMLHVINSMLGDQSDLKKIATKLMMQFNFHSIPDEPGTSWPVIDFFMTQIQLMPSIKIRTLFTLMLPVVKAFSNAKDPHELFQLFVAAYDTAPPAKRGKLAMKLLLKGQLRDIQLTKVIENAEKGKRRKAAKKGDHDEKYNPPTKEKPKTDPKQETKPKKKRKRKKKSKK